MTAMAAQPNGRPQAEESDLHVSECLPSRRPRGTIRNAISFPQKRNGGGAQPATGQDRAQQPLTRGNLLTSNFSIDSDVHLMARRQGRGGAPGSAAQMHAVFAGHSA
ncbi:hypothetical protein C2845_PM09G24430 [Panicum miliaceum]|uniref:Uncharacterized protein n=1 Tax=Panicum miliaceum TaxID=4540 RepID=A0A3L6RWN4_PANMI|nr:hypothetical protein C2845_PM09G24430 [Panicum miliaceum]